MGLSNARAPGGIHRPGARGQSFPKIHVEASVSIVPREENETDGRPRRGTLDGKAWKRRGFTSRFWRACRPDRVPPDGNHVQRRSPATGRLPLSAVRRPVCRASARRAPVASAIEMSRPDMEYGRSRSDGSRTISAHSAWCSRARTAVVCMRFVLCPVGPTFSLRPESRSTRLPSCTNGRHSRHRPALHPPWASASRHPVEE